jgi:putative thioredoxin
MTSQTMWVLETDDATFAQEVIERSKEVPVVVDFWAKWCQPCLVFGPILERLAREFASKVVLVKADLDQTPAVAQRFGVSSIPAVYGFRDGELYDSFVGAWPERQLRAWIEQLLPTQAEQRVAKADRMMQVDPQSAEPLYRQALELDPTLAKAKIGLAAALLLQDRFAECQ